MNAPICRSADNAVTGLMSPDGVSPAPAPDLAALLDEAREALEAVTEVLDMALGIDLLPPGADGPAAKARAAISRIDAVRKEKP